MLNQEVLTPQGYTHIEPTKIASQVMFQQEPWSTHLTHHLRDQ